MYTEFPMVAGVIYGTQIPIAAPYKLPEQYVNRKGQFSLNCQVVVNHRGAITHLSCRWPGSLHDSRVLQESNMQQVLIDTYLVNIICWETQVMPAKPIYSHLIQLKTMRGKCSEFVHLIFGGFYFKYLFFMKKLNKSELVNHCKIVVLKNT